MSHERSNCKDKNCIKCSSINNFSETATEYFQNTEKKRVVFPNFPPDMHIVDTNSALVKKTKIKNGDLIIKLKRLPPAYNVRAVIAKNDKGSFNVYTVKYIGDDIDEGQCNTNASIERPSISSECNYNAEINFYTISCDQTVIVGDVPLNATNTSIVYKSPLVREAEIIIEGDEKRLLVTFKAKYPPVEDFKQFVTVMICDDCVLYKYFIYLTSRTACPAA